VNEIMLGNLSDVRRY